MIARIAAAALALIASGAALAGDGVVVRDPWARASAIVSRPAAAYLTVESAAGDRLTGVTSPVAEKVQVHAVEETNGVSRMVHLPVLDLPAGEPVVLAPGRMHLMLVGLRSALEEGQSFPMTLEFEASPDVTVEVPVLAMGAQGPAHAGH